MADHIQVTLPDGSKKEVASGTTPLDIARSISPRLADAALVAKIKPSAVRHQHYAPDQNGGPAGQQSEGKRPRPACTHLLPKMAGNLPISANRCKKTLS